MTRHISEERLALCAAGDLPARETAGLEQHLRGCGECQALLAEYRNAQEFLTASVQDPDPEELRQLRDGIARELRDSGGRASVRWWWPAVVAAGLALVFVSNWQRGVHPDHSRGQMTPQVWVPERVPDMPALPAPRLEIAAVQRKPAAPAAGLRTVALVEQADQPPFIKMTTHDPNVVILWQATERIQ